MGEKKGIKKNREKLIFGIAMGMFATSVVLQLLARQSTGFGEWYTVYVYPLIVGTMGRMSGLVPFSVVEIGAYLLILVSIRYVVVHFRELKKVLVRVIFLLTGLFLLFTLNCGVNYYRKPFSDYTDLKVEKSSKEELKNLCVFLTEEVNALCEAGAEAKISAGAARTEGVKAMKKIGDEYVPLSGFYPQPKALLWSYFFSAQQLCGQYSPFTVEATYNGVMPDYNIPHTICHELSHLRGFMREDEANFIGYLACIGSDNEAYRYSGYLTGWVYATNALAKTSMEDYQAICGLLDDRAWVDLRENNEFWGRYDGKVSEVSSNLNDAYLKINSQADGVKSYGRVVDLMLALQRKTKGANSW